jgi:hypothetical protein
MTASTKEAVYLSVAGLQAVPTKEGAYLSVGDFVLYGKYKNKKGRIKAFKTNAKGDPVVVVEPVPKGRKQPKELVFLKVRKMPKEQIKELKKKKAQRIVARFLYG